jgi:hypothetical protein
LKPILASEIRRGVGRRLRVLSEPVRRKLLRISPRSDNDYATHIPILIGLANRFRIEQVLELGCGEFSTAMFLDTQSFAKLTRLDSFDTDQSWLDKTARYAGSDQRYYPRLVSESMASAIKESDLQHFDLILVDDSTSAVERAATIKQLANRRPLDVLIVIHDFEMSEYRRAAADFEYRQVFRALTPQTGVVWNGNSAPSRIIKELELQIRQFAKMIQPDDIQGWIRVFQNKRGQP